MLRSLFALLTVVTVALAVRVDHMKMFARQSPTDAVPAACQSQCATFLNIYGGCVGGSGNSTGCNALCTSANVQGFASCINCAIQNTPGVTAEEISDAQDAISALQQVCVALGSSIGVPSLSAPSVVASGSASATGLASLASGSISITSRASSISSAVASLSSSAAAATSSAAGGVSNAGGGPSASASASAAASSKAAAGRVISPVSTGFIGIGAALLAVLAGAAVAL